MFGLLVGHRERHNVHTFLGYIPRSHCLEAPVTRVGRIGHDGRYVVLLTITRDTLARHTLCASQFTVIGNMENNGVVTQAQAVQLNRVTFHITDTVQVAIVQPVLAYIFVADDTDQSTTGAKLILMDGAPLFHQWLVAGFG